MAQGMTVAELVAVLRADSGQFSTGMRDADKQIKTVEASARTTGDTFNKVSMIAGGLGTALVTGSVMAGKMISQTGIQMNSLLETTTLQFRTLLGGTAAAAQEAATHVRSLFDFAKKTPFETAPVIEASRMMHTFGGSALDTAKNLTMVGNASAATSANIGEVAFWTGRMYTMLKAGRPFGEAAMRLQELAILSPDVRAKMESMTAAGKNWHDIWSVFTNDMGRFNNAMALQAQTWTGLTSTISDSLKLAAGDMTRPMFDALKNLMTQFVAFTSSPAWTSIIDMGRKVFGVLGDKINEASQKIGEFLHNFDGGNMLSTIVEMGKKYAELGGIATGVFASMSAGWVNSLPFIGHFVTKIPMAAGVLVGLMMSTKEGRDAMLEFATAMVKVADALVKAALPAINMLAKTLSAVLIAALQILTPLLQVIADNADIVAAALMAVGGAMLAMKVAEFITGLMNVYATIKLVVDQAGGMKSAIANMAGGMAGGGLATLGFGAALGIAGFAISSIMQKQQEHKKLMEDYTKVIDAQGNAIKGAADVSIRSHSSDSKLGEAMRANASDAKLFTQAIKEGGGHMSNWAEHATEITNIGVDKFFEMTGGGADHLTKRMKELANSMSAADFIKLTRDLNEQRSAFQDAGDAAVRHNKTIGDTKDLAARNAAYKDAKGALTDYQIAMLQANEVTATRTKEVAQKAQEMSDSMKSSFGQATDIVKALGSQTEVTQQQIDDFYRTSIMGASQWAGDLSSLAKAGVDQGLLQRLAAAGPAAEPLVKALLDKVAGGGLGVINQAEKDAQNILNTVNTNLAESMVAQAGVVNTGAQGITALWKNNMGQIPFLARSIGAETNTNFMTVLSVMSQVAASGGKKSADEIAKSLGVTPGVVAAIVVAAQGHIDLLHGKTVDLDANDRITQAVQRAQAAIDRFGASAMTAARAAGLSVPGSAAGGKIPAFRPRLVGERGPEIIYPTMASTVIPNDQLGMVGGATINVGSIVVQGADDPQATAYAVRDELIKIGRRNGSALGQYA